MTDASEGATVQGAALAPVVAYLQSLLGVRVDGNRGMHLLGALQDAVTRDGAPTVEEFLQRVDADASVRDELISVATVGETYFFRHPEQLATLAERVIPDVLAHRTGDRPLRLWSAGCASGEEPYTLAMLTEDAGVSTAKIIATDVSRRALAKASTAEYGSWSLRGDQRHIHRFEQVGDAYRVPGRLAGRVEFRPLNLLHDPYPQDRDIVLCRNVLMYLEPTHIQRVAERLAASLARGGWLITAPADPAFDFGDALEPVLTPGGVMYRRPDARAAHRQPRKPKAAATAARPRHEASADAAGHRTPRESMGPRPAEGAPTLALALQTLDQGDHAAAAELAQAVVGAGEDTATVRAVWARALGNAGRIPEGEAVAAAAAVVFPLDAELRYLHAELLIEAGRPDAAVAQASAAAYLDPDLGVAHLVLGRAELARGRPDAARRAFRTAGELLDALPARRVAGYAGAYEAMATHDRRRR